VNESSYPYWKPGTRSYIDYVKEHDPPTGRPRLAYIGSLVADFHRNLLYGDLSVSRGHKTQEDTGKLRLMYEGIRWPRRGAGWSTASTGTSGVMMCSHQTASARAAHPGFERGRGDVVEFAKRNG